MKYHLFISYARTPDAPLARELERFLESFHQTPVDEAFQGKLKPLNIFLDASDFNMPPPQENALADGRRREVGYVIDKNLARSRELLVLCSKGAARSVWVAQEVQWFLEHRGAGAIRLAWTEGKAPWQAVEDYFPQPLLEHNFDSTRAGYDLRGYDSRRAEGWRQVPPDFERELVKLAADLHGLAGGDLYPSWLKAELDRTRAESLRIAVTV